MRRDVLAKGSATDHAVFASVARIHNQINGTLFDRPQDIKGWKQLLDLDNPPRPAAADRDLWRGPLAGGHRVAGCWLDAFALQR
ncbi:hypothetical protein NKH72_34255 [Mesorhizobium sp. M0955]|uniref:hypothetical protein n=1 Tax=Mesorhizobium sp. M0955 TaxID=2957033 RepID=UPI003334A857